MISMWNLKSNADEFTKQEQTHKQKTNLWLPKGKGWGID